MLTKRVIPCLDVRNGRVTKGVKFKNNIDLGDPVEMAVNYSDNGADELVFYDITASAEKRATDIGMVAAVAAAVHIPFAVGGGVSTLGDMERVILAGAEKVSVNSAAVRHPEIIAEGARAFGRQCIVLGMDPVRNEACPSGYEVTTCGFRVRTGMDAVEWAQRAAEAGAGEIVVNSVDADGTRAGFELEITRKIADAVGVPVVASGGAGIPQHLTAAFREGHADAAIVAGMIHTGDYTIADIKRVLVADGIPTRFNVMLENPRVRLNPDADAVARLERALEVRNGYCPCRVQKIPENICPCTEFCAQVADDGFTGLCHCRLYEKV